MASSGASVSELLRRLWRAWRRHPGSSRPARARARSSLFHLRMETRHRDTYHRLSKGRDPHNPG